MAKRLWSACASLIGAALILMLVACGPSPRGIEITKIEARSQFPDSIIFEIHASSDQDIVKAELRYQVQHMSCGPIVASGVPDYQQSQSLELQWALDLSAIGGLPAGANLTYWWVLADTQGETYESIQRTLVFEDSRFQWRQARAENIILHWYDGTQAFAETILEVANQTVADFESAFGISPSRPIHVRLYADALSLRQAVPLSHEWTGGVSYPAHGLVSIGNNQADSDWTMRAILHEVVHVAVGEASFFCGAAIPAWLDEGLATYAEGAQSAQLTWALDRAIERNAVYSLDSIAGDFPYTLEAAQLAYAQSRSIVEYLVHEFGAGSVAQLLQSFQSFGSIDRAVREVYGIDKSELERRWRVALGLSGDMAVGNQSPILIPLPQIDPLTVPR